VSLVEAMKVLEDIRFRTTHFQSKNAI
jgi:hypothetical protein